MERVIHPQTRGETQCALVEKDGCLYNRPVVEPPVDEQIGSHMRPLELLLKQRFGSESDPYYLFLELAGRIENSIRPLTGPGRPGKQGD